MKSKWSVAVLTITLVMGLLTMGVARATTERARAAKPTTAPKPASVSASTPVTAVTPPAPVFAPHAADSLKNRECASAGCHAKFAAPDKSAHDPVAQGMCTACHEVKPDAKPRYVNGSADKACAECHSVMEDAAKAHTPHPPAAEGCLDCHAPHSSPNARLLREKLPDLCVTCHEKEPLAVHVIAGMQAGRGHPLQGAADPARKGEPFTCASCHEPHGSSGPSLLRYKAASTFDLCQHCHPF